MKNIKIDNRKDLLICECNSTDHQMILLYEYDEELDINNNVIKTYPMCFAHIHLAKYPFWQRVKYGIKYIFGYQSRYGAFDEFIFKPEDAPKLQDLVDHLNEQIEFLK
ncbi:MAG: hypothetical protein JXA99_02140 [Candidatus Lokiarchaeota archaeon]|jgi:hypothetical protein|nr:hypothetical protein [Candidatus Lokiarchaeota archaeon]